MKYEDEYVTINRWALDINGTEGQYKMNNNTKWFMTKQR